MKKKNVVSSVYPSIPNKKIKLDHHNNNKSSNIAKHSNDLKKKIECINKDIKKNITKCDNLNSTNGIESKQESIDFFKVCNIKNTQILESKKCSQDNLSSDESFDGVKWKISPEKFKNINDNYLFNHSSPLMNLKLINLMKTVEGKSSLNNDQSASVVSNYDSDFYKFSSDTSILNKNTPEIISSQLLKKNFFLNSQKGYFNYDEVKNNLKTIEKIDNHLNSNKNQKDSNLSSTLNNWIVKFDSKHHDVNKNLFPSEKNCENELNDINLVSDNKFYQNNKIPMNLDEIIFSDFSDSSPIKTPSNIIYKNNETNLTKFTNSENKKLLDFNANIQNSSKINECKKITDIFSTAEIDDISDIKESNNTSKESKYINKISVKSFDSDTSFSDYDIDNSILKTNDNFDMSAKKTSINTHWSLKLNDIKNIKSYSSNEDSSIKISYQKENLKRFKIKKILHKKYGINLNKDQLILEVIDSKKTNLKLIIRDQCLMLNFELNDIINVVITNFDNPNLIDDFNNLLIWNPDILLSTTTISQQLNCPRKTVLMSKMKFQESSTIPLISGTIVHAIFENCFIREDWSISFMNQILEKEIKNYVLEIYILGSEIEPVKCEIKSHFPYLEFWFKKYYKKNTKLQKSSNKNFSNNYTFSIENALNIEEIIWSPTYGIKGIIDATVITQTNDKKKNNITLMPLEIKTGKNYITHNAQGSLYSLLISDKYNIDINSFLLVYTKEKITNCYDVKFNELKDLINLRNKIVMYFKENCNSYPSLIKRSICNICEVQQPCMVINKLIENGSADESGISPNIYDELTNHLNDKQHYKDFYFYWDYLISCEENFLNNTKKYLWTLLSSERENCDGKSVGNLIIKKLSSTSNAYYYIFERESQTNDSNFLNSQFEKFDRVILSDEIGNFAIGIATIVSVNLQTIIVSTDKDFFSLENKFKVKCGDKSSLSNKIFYSSFNNEKTYRIDKDDYFYGLTISRFNLLSLFLSKESNSSREIIIDYRQPVFLKSDLKFDVMNSKLNSDQKKTIENTLSSDKFSLILGMPGTGKTFVIVELIKILVNNNKSVILTSHTNSAIDNVLYKLKLLNINFIRIGSSSRVQDEIKDHTLEHICDKFNDYKSLIEECKKTLVFGTTCYGINDMVFNLKPNFDYCIMDESSQVSFPLSLGPLRLANKFVLVGDHFQLPPLVHHINSKIKDGLSQSLFKILVDKYPECVNKLTYQYRMNIDIMYLSNFLIYNNQLKCGSDDVANQKLKIDNIDKLNDFIINKSLNCEDDDWLKFVLLEKNSVVFLNHDKVPALEESTKYCVSNPIEVDLVEQIVDALIICGIKENSIGIISLYRHHLRLLNRILKNKKKLKIMTVDQFQGRDKDCIIISLVRSNNQKNSGDLIKDWKRFNVSITRAKSKLIVIGSLSTFQNSEIIKSFLEILKKKNCIKELPFNANKIYNFKKK